MRRLHPVGPLADQGQEFGARLLLFAETAEHGGGHGLRVLLFNAAHHHAKMASFNNDTYPLRLDNFLDRLGNLSSQALLYLQAARESFNQSRNLAQPDYLTV